MYRDRSWTSVARIIPALSVIKRTQNLSILSMSLRFFLLFFCRFVPVQGDSFERIHRGSQLESCWKRHSPDVFVILVLRFKYFVVKPTRRYFLRYFCGSFRWDTPYMHTRLPLSSYLSQLFHPSWPTLRCSYIFYTYRAWFPESALKSSLVNV